LDRESEVFAAILRRFTDSHREVAEQRGHEELLRFLDLKEDVLRRMAARRRVGVELLRGLIDEVRHRLSYDDESEANEAVHRIIPALAAYESCFQRQRDVCEHLVRQAAGERAAANASESDLPDWDAIVNARAGDSSGLAELGKLITAFRDGGDDGAPSFVPATKNDLKERLDHLFPAERRFSDSWVDRRLKDAIACRIVVKLPRADGQSRRVPDIFQLSDAAVRKYGRHLPPESAGHT
jgi:hypothetical protein